MTIQKTTNGKALTLALDGRLDTTTAPDLEAELKASLPGADDLTLDMKGIAYISSAGLRVLLAAQKQMNASKGAMKLINVCDEVREVFEITGFTDVLTIQ